MRTRTSENEPSARGAVAVEPGEFDALLRVCANLTAPQELEELLGSLLREARQLVHAQAGSLYVVEQQQLRFVCRQNEARVKDVSESLPSHSAAAVPLSSESLAGHVAVTGRPLNIPDVYKIPETSPFRFDTTYDEASGYRTKSMLAVPLCGRDEGVAGVLQVINRLGDGGRVDAFSERDMLILTSLGAVAAVSLRNARLHDELRRSHMDTIVRLATAAEFRDGDTGEHIRRMSCYCEAIARKLGMGREWARQVLLASPMHDVGKLGVPDAILGKPGPLTPEERAIMQQHTTIGAKILENAENDILRMARDIALSHHERWDGKGYPHGLAGEHIPLAARIASVADVFDALTNARVYKPPFPLPKAFEMIREGRGTQFDEACVDAFVAIEDDVRSIHEAYQPQ